MSLKFEEKSGLETEMQRSLKVATTVSRTGVWAGPQETPIFTKGSEKKKPEEEQESQESEEGLDNRLEMPQDLAPGPLPVSTAWQGLCLARSHLLQVHHEYWPDKQVMGIEVRFRWVVELTGVFLPGRDGWVVQVRKGEGNYGALRSRQRSSQERGKVHKVNQPEKSVENNLKRIQFGVMQPPAAQYLRDVKFNAGKLSAPSTVIPL